VAQPLIAIDAKAMIQGLSFVEKQIPYVCKLAVTDLAYRVMRAERASFATTFKNPRPWTANSVFVKEATKTDLEAVTFVRPGTDTYLMPYEVGGDHVLPGTALLNPKGVSLDQYGQLRKGTMKSLSARPDIYIGPIKTSKGLINGVWQRLQVTRTGKVQRRPKGRGSIYHAVLGRLKLLIRFGDALPVTEHIDFNERAEQVVVAGAADAFEIAIKKAWR
jgi:hypothetical protein